MNINEILHKSPKEPRFGSVDANGRMRWTGLSRHGIGPD